MLIGGITYGAKKELGMALFQQGLALNPDAPIALVEYANGLVMLEGERLTSVQQVEQLVRISRELYREVATGDQAREIYQIGTQYRDADETLARLGYLPNRASGERGMPQLRRVA